jgi:SsrA-binding protein
VAEKKRIDIPNKKAGFNFHIEDKYAAGMMLQGSEVKSVRAHNLNMGDAYCVFENGELFVRNLHISEFKQASFAKHEPMRQRKLLLSKKELKKLEQKAKTKGYTIFPIRIFENERGIFKMEIGIGQGKKMYDKREDLKEKDVKRDLEKYKL